MEEKKVRTARDVALLTRHKARRYRAVRDGAPFLPDVRRLRIAFNLTLTACAAAVGVSVRTFWRAERGEDVSLRTAIKIARFFEKRVDDLFRPNPRAAR